MSVAWTGKNRLQNSLESGFQSANTQGDDALVQTDFQRFNSSFGATAFALTVIKVPVSRKLFFRKLYLWMDSAVMAVGNYVRIDIVFYLNNSVVSRFPQFVHTTNLDGFILEVTNGAPGAQPATPDSLLVLYSVAGLAHIRPFKFAMECDRIEFECSRPINAALTVFGHIQSSNVYT